MPLDRHHGSRLALTLAAAAAAWAAPACPSHASTLRHDVSEDLYVDYGDPFHLIGGVTVDLTSFGTGVVVHPEWVMTAAHVVGGVTENSIIRFETDPDPNDPDVTDGDDDTIPLSGLFGITQVAIHQFYDDGLGPAGGFDIALLRLDAPVNHYTPYDRYRGGVELGRQGTAVGFGATGTGITGYDAQTGGFFRLAGDNMIDAIADDPRIIEEFFARTVVDPDTGQTIEFTREQIAAQFLLSDFDDPASAGTYVNDGLNPLGDADPLPLEASVAPGDSGGPMFYFENGQWQIGGINSFIHGLEPPFGDGTDNANYSDLAGYLRVGLFNEWIDGVIGVVPEPGSASVVAILSGALLLRRSRRRAS
jgi:hypothetical protein